MKLNIRSEFAACIAVSVLIRPIAWGSRAVSEDAIDSKTVEPLTDFAEAVESRQK